MDKVLKLICMSAIVTLIAGCGNKQDEPESEPVTETWVITYDDYHSILDIDESEKQKYKNLSCEVTIVRDGEEEISIKGIFEEYPDAWIKGRIINDKVFIGNSQAIGTKDGETVYSEWGYVRHSSEYEHIGNTSRYTVPEAVEFRIVTGPLLKFLTMET